MKINLRDDKVGYFSVRKRQVKSELKLHSRIKTLADEESVPNEQQLDLEPKIKQPKKLHPLQIPSQRYFKRVLNKDISPKKPSGISATSRTSTKRKQFPRISAKQPSQQLNHASSQLNSIEQRQNQSSTYNFSVGLINQANALNSSFFTSEEPPARKSAERKLDFNKIFIQTQEQSYRSVIQLSVRDLQNKEMLQKAVQELDKRKFQKKIKILKKNMGMNSPKSRRKVDQAIEMLRNQSIGYKTFYRNEISTGRYQSQSQDKSLLKSSRDPFKTPRKGLSTLQDESNDKMQTLKSTNSEKIIYKLKPINNIIIEDQEQAASKQRDQEENDTSSDQQNQGIQDELRKADQMFKSKMDSREIIMQNSGANEFKIPPLISRVYQSMTKRDLSLQINSQNLKISKTPCAKSSSASLQRLSTIIKSTQDQTVSMTRKRAHTKILQSIQGPFEPDQLQQNTALKQVQIPSEEFPFLMTKQDLQTTLNKSRYQMKKLLCMHVQRRQKQWKQVRRKMLLQEDNLETIQQEKHRKKQKLKVNVLPPEYLLKIPTKQLKKSVRSFVSLLNSSRNLSPKQKQKLHIKIT